MGSWCGESTGPRLSWGRPSTSMMRPRVALPTGTEIGLPVERTARPRLRPSDAPMAMVRTTPSPSCCCTSRIRSESASCSASYMCGICSRGNSTSMTAPMIWVILPSAILVMHFSSNGRGAADDLRKFLGDRSLAGLVVNELQVLDELAGVVGGGLHGHHARGHFGRDVLDDTLVHLRFDVAHQQAVGDRSRIRLIDVVPVLRQPLIVGRVHRQQL